jgi:WD40 repeat protein
MKPFVVAALVIGAVFVANAPCGGQKQKEPVTLKGHQHWVMCLAFSPDGKTLASGSRDHTIRLWDIPTAKQVRTIECPTAFAAAFSPDGRSLATGGADERIKNRGWDVGGMAKLFDVATGTDKMTFREHKDTIISLAFSPDGKTLATGDDFGGPIRLWTIATGKCRLILSRHTPVQVRCLAFSPDGSALASGGGGGYFGQPAEINLWEVASGRLRATLLGHTGVVDSLAFSLNGRTLASGSGDETIRLWDMLSGKTQKILRANKKESGYSEGVSFLAFARDAHTLVSGSYSVLRIWDLDSGSAKTVVKDQSFISFALSPNGNVMACGNWDGSIKLWDIPAANKTDK